MKSILLDTTVNWQLTLQGMGMVVTIIVAFLVYLFARINMKYETTERLSRFRKEKLLEAGMAFWSLLAYTTFTENPSSILWWTREKNSDKTKYYVHTGNANAFMASFNTINYEKGYGLFLSTKVRALFYEYRNILYGFLLKTQDEPSEKILVENEKMIERMKELHEKVILAIRDEMGLKEPSL